MNRVLVSWKSVALLVACALLPAAVAGAANAPVAVFPLRDMGFDRDGINLSFTRDLSDRLARLGTNVSPPDAVIRFMALNRIRIAGELEAFHVKQAREELGAAFVLLGTVLQSKELPIPTLAISLNLVRTYDGRTLWSYVGGLSTADERRLLGIGEPKSQRDLQAILLEEIAARWPKDEVNKEPQRVASVDSLVLEPQHARPGTEVTCSVRLRNVWAEERAPRIFFKADDQLYAASFAPKTNTYEASWIAGDKEGRFPVALVFEWPLYGRTETLDLGSYVVDGLQPLVALDLKGGRIEGDMPLFAGEVVFIPRMLVQKPLSRWRLTVRNSADLVVVEEKGEGSIPGPMVWGGGTIYEGREIEGVFRADLDVWDQSGNKASASRRLELSKKPPRAEIVAARKESRVTVSVREGENRLPLYFWRLEVRSEEGRLLNAAEGADLPADVVVELTAADAGKKIEGVLQIQDVLGNKSRIEVKDLLGSFEKESARSAAEKKTATETWVKDF